MVRKPIVEMAEGIAGGKGITELHNIITAEEFGKAGSFYGKCVIKPGGSVGYHQHVGNTEPYFVLSGKGIFTDSDGSRIPVSAGDVCVIKNGESHGIENASDTEDFEFIAMIYNFFD